MCVLVKVIEQDYELSGSGRWLKPKDKYNDPSSLVVDVENEIFFWNSRGIYGNVIDWLTRVKGMSEEEAKRYVRTLDSTLPVPETGFDGRTVPYDGLVESFWTNGKNNRQYWYDRLLTDSTIDRFKLGYFDGSYTIPIYNEGKLTNIQCRRDVPEKRIFLWYRGMSPVIFNSSLLDIASSVIICEGLVDAILLSQFGVPTVASMGGASTWLKEWNSKFLYINPIYVVYDNDSAGRLGAKRVAQNLGEYKTKIFTFEGKKDKYDVIDFFRDGGSITDFVPMIQKESKYSFEI